MNLEQVMNLVRIDNTVKGIRREGWESGWIQPSKEVNVADKFFTYNSHLNFDMEVGKYTPNLRDIAANDWIVIK